MDMSSVFVSLNLPPYLLQVDLKDRVDHLNAQVTLDQGTIQLTLPKETKGLWGELKARGSRAELLQRRNAAFEENVRIRQEQLSELKTKRGKQNKEAHEMQWKCDDARRDTIRSIKQTEEDTGKNEITSWALDISPSPISVQRTNECYDESDREGPVEEDVNSNIWTSEPANPRDSTKRDTRMNIDVGDVGSNKKLPPVRNSGMTHVNQASFASRPMMQPSCIARNKDDEDEFRSSAIVKGCSDNMGESHSELLNDKGIQCLESRDYLSAINAFSEALRLDPQNPIFFYNRSKTYYRFVHNGSFEPGHALQRIRKAISDSNVAISMLLSTHHKRLRAQTLVLRGIAQGSLGCYRNAIADVEDALILVDGIDMFDITGNHSQSVSDILDGWMKKEQKCRDGVGASLYHQVEDALQESRIDEAIGIANNLVDQMPFDVYALRLRALAKYEKKLYANAWDDILIALSTFDDPHLHRSNDETLRKQLHTQGARALEGLERFRDAFGQIQAALHYTKDDNDRDLKEYAVLIQQRLATHSN